MKRNEPMRPLTEAQRREERLAKALRENLKRRKAAPAGAAGDKPAGPDTRE